jgi:hypothetical protein
MFEAAGALSAGRRLQIRLLARTTEYLPDKEEVDGVRQ